MRKIYLFVLAALFINSTNAQQKTVSSFTDGKYIKVNNANLWVVTVGEGDPVIIIPGGPGDSHIFYRTFDSLAKAHHQVIYFDPFGRGKSDTAKDVSWYTLARDIDDVEALRKALALDRVSVLGQSYGGIVAQGYAIKFPSHLSHLILANTLYNSAMWQENNDSQKPGDKGQFSGDIQPVDENT